MDQQFIIDALDEEILSDDDFSNSDLDSDIVVESEHDTCTDESGLSCDENESSDQNYLGKDGTKWKAQMPPSNSRTRSHNLVTHLPGVKGVAKNSKTIIDSWQLFFPDEVISEIVNFTNIKIQKIREHYSRVRDAKDTDIIEMKAIIGLLYLSGSLRSSHQNLCDLWRTDGLGVDYFHATMNIRRFRFILQCLRFDDVNSRNTRIKTDRLAPVRNIFDGFVDRCQKYYTVGEYVTVDEMLESFRGKCRFRQYIANKPAKYGIKIFSLVDSRTFYTLNMEIYCGQQEEGPYKVVNSGKEIVLRLIKPISKTGRNVTCDNWFTSVPLATELLKKHRITMVGTIRKNKREIPPNFCNTRGKIIQSNMFGFTKDMTLVSHVPKKSKIVLLLSTMHHDNAIDSNLNKPEIITFYNMTKGGVDVVDDLKDYSVARISRRWPLTIFYSLLNIAGINSQLIYKANNNCNINRREFLQTLGKQLTMGYLQQRINIKTLPIEVKRKIASILREKYIEQPNAGPTREGRCYYCDRKKNRKTKNAM
ncbi:uncharacterized protein LOC132933083 [Metopolophium dirhodum]|uniref:uncharacterized protein LOC132933083 n=1 Tax=Metopolophium dirhodum TaxID=44670 RepID=UPI00298F3FCF|nr:uncharacterized protein LOC132933083 [Metopolophium dirhodum]